MLPHSYIQHLTCCCTAQAAGRTWRAARAFGREVHSLQHRVSGSTGSCFLKGEVEGQGCVAYSTVRVAAPGPYFKKIRVFGRWGRGYTACHTGWVEGRIGGRLEGSAGGSAGHA